MFKLLSHMLCLRYARRIYLHTEHVPQAAFSHVVEPYKTACSANVYVEHTDMEPVSYLVYRAGTIQVHVGILETLHANRSTSVPLGLGLPLFAFDDRN
jgi:hypothetical protein